MFTWLRSWIQRQRGTYVEYRRKRAIYREQVRSWMQGTLREELHGKNLLLGGALAVAGPFVYRALGGSGNLVNLALATGLPFLAYIAGVWLFARWRAPVHVVARYHAEWESAHPPLPWIIAAEHRRESIVLRLLTRGQPELVDDASCTIHLSDYKCKVKHPVTERRQVSPDEPIEYVYPDDFISPTWPLEPGTYHLTYEMHGDFGGVSQGHELKVEPFSGADRPGG